jgi:general secretion pathway protein D
MKKNQVFGASRYPFVAWVAVFGCPILFGIGTPSADAQQQQQVTVNPGSGFGAAVGNPFVYPVPQQVEQGPVLDVIPNVLSDGYTINLTLIPTLAEFAGYDNPQEVAASGFQTPPGTVVLPTVLPRFTVRQVVTTVNVWDGQTVVLGGLISDRVTSIKDKVPVLGDLPLLGRFFRSEQKTTTKKNLVIFVTPTMIDPAGNRLHTDEEMPFALSTIPPQPKETGPIPIAPPVAKPQGQTPGNE